jgi:EEF1A N-terminal glycine/lysine methyltransferase
MSKCEVENGDNDGEEIALEDSFFMFVLPDDDSNIDQIEPTITLKYDTYLRHSLPQDPRLEVLETVDERTIKLALTSKHHSLWAEYVYNAARVIADLIDNSPFVSKDLPRIDVRGKRCLELGAGAGLPGIMAILNGASEVVISDYGHDADLSLIYPIDINIQKARNEMKNDQIAFAVGYVWGQPAEYLCEAANYYQSSEFVDTSSYGTYLQSKSSLRIEKQSPQNENLKKFDILFLADLIFNRSEHSRLLWTVKNTLRVDLGVCWVSFSHHDPLKKELDLNFFEMAKQEPYNLNVNYVGKEIRQTYPFREGDGLDEQRGIVYLYTLTM